MDMGGGRKEGREGRREFVAFKDVSAAGFQCRGWKKKRRSPNSSRLIKKKKEKKGGRTQ